MAEAPWLTIVTVNLDHASGLAATQASIASQLGVERVEWLVVDGGSTDESIEVVTTGYQPRFLISRPDRGIYHAMNTGLGLAGGRWVLMLNSGDTFADHQVVARIESEACDRDAWFYGARWHSGVLDDFNPYSFRAHALGRRVVPHQAVVMGVDLLSALGGYREDFGLAADQELLLRAAVQATPGAVSDPWIVQESGGVSSTRRPRDHIRDMRRARSLNGISVYSPSVDWLLDQAFVFRAFLGLGRLKRRVMR